MKNRMKKYTLMAATFLAFSPVIGFSDEVNQQLFGTQPTIVTHGGANVASETLLEDYSYYVGNWRNSEKLLSIDATGKDIGGGQIAYDTYGNVTLSYSVGGVIIMAVPAGYTYPHDATIGDTTKDRLYLIQDYPYPVVLYREADYLAMIAGASTGTVTEKVSETEAVVSAQSTDTNKSGLRVLPKTSEVGSVMTVLGVVMSLLGLVGLKKRIL